MSAIKDPLPIGLHDGIPAEVYHSDPCIVPSLSSGVARKIAEKSPAHAFLEHVRLGGSKPEPTADMILGGYVHGLLAGDVTDFEVGIYDNFTTKDAKAWRDCVKLSGKTPILEHVADRAGLIANALREKAALGLTTNPFESGRPEITAVWQEEELWLRARFDRLILDPAGFGDAWDWKTTGTGVTEDAIVRTIIDKGYHVQAAFYLRGLKTLAPEYQGRTSFILAFVETEPPFAVRRVPVCQGFLSAGNRIVEKAIARWRESMRTGAWPDYSGDSLMVTPPTWYLQKIGMEDLAA